MVAPPPSAQVAGRGGGNVWSADDDPQGCCKNKTAVMCGMAETVEGSQVGKWWWCENLLYVLHASLLKQNKNFNDSLQSSTNKNLKKWRSEIILQNLISSSIPPGHPTKASLEYQRISIDRTKLSEDEAFEHAIDMISSRQMGFRKAADFFQVRRQKIQECLEELWWI